MPLENEQTIILAELKPGIDLRNTDLVTGPGEYWLKDENDGLALTHYSGVIAGNLWTVSGNSLILNDSGFTSEFWELDGTSLKLKV
jgi:hypothetical protein